LAAVGRWRWIRALGAASAAILVLGTVVHAGILDASWTEPTTNVDGTPLTDLAGYRLYYDVADADCLGSTFEEIVAAQAAPPPGSTASYRLTGLSSGTAYFVAVAAVDASGNESDCLRAEHSAVARSDYFVSPAATTSFGSVPLNGFAQRTFIVKNTGGGTVSGTVATAAPFRVVSGGTFSLAGMGAWQVVTVRFSPTAVAVASASVTVRANGGSVSRIVTGTGVAADFTPPTVAIASPTTASTIRTTRTSQTLAGTAADDIGVTRVNWKNSAGGSGVTAGTSAWSATDIPLQMGTNVITITARDAAGNTATDRLTVTRLERTPPAVSITAPAASSTLAGAVTVSARATDNVGVVGVQLKLDGVNLGPELTAAPYAMTWQTATAAPGSHVLTAVARDASGNRTTSAPVPVIVWSTPQ
jgi:hypothetical protein